MGVDKDNRAVQVFFKLRDLSELVGVEKHVLRYWEKEFDHIQPMKIGTRRNLYTAEHLEKFKEIKRLLKNEGYTLAGARKHLNELYPQKNVPGVLSFSEGVRKEPGAYLPDGLTKDAPKDAPKGGPGYVPKDATGDSPENEPDLALSFLSGYPDDDDDDDLESETSLPQDFGLETLIPVRPAEAPPPAALNGSQGKGGHGPEAALKLTPDGEVPTPNFVAKPPAEPESEKLIKSLNLPKVKSPSETALANWPPNDEGKKELLEDLLFIRGILARPVE